MVAGANGSFSYGGTLAPKRALLAKKGKGVVWNLHSKEGGETTLRRRSGGDEVTGGRKLGGG